MLSVPAIGAAGIHRDVGNVLRWCDRMQLPILLGRRQRRETWGVCEDSRQG